MQHGGSYKTRRLPESPLDISLLPQLQANYRLHNLHLHDSRHPPSAHFLTQAPIPICSLGFQSPPLIHSSPIPTIYLDITCPELLPILDKQSTTPIPFIETVSSTKHQHQHVFLGNPLVYIADQFKISYQLAHLFTNNPSTRS